MRPNRDYLRTNALLLAVAFMLAWMGGGKDQGPAGESFPNSAGDKPAAAGEAPVSKPLTLTPLISETLSPSDSPQTVAYQNRIKVTIPGGLLKDSRKLTISSIDDPPPPNDEGFTQGAVYDISLDGLSQFDEDILIEFPYVPTGLEGKYPAAALNWVEFFEPSKAIWYPVPSTMDPQRKTVIVRTRHLSTYALLTPLGGDDYKLGIYEDSLTGTLLLVIHFNEKEVRKSTIQFKEEPLSFELRNAGKTTFHGYVAKLAEYAFAALAKYRESKFDLYSKPLHIYLGAPPPKRKGFWQEMVPDALWPGIPSAKHNSVTGEISFNTTPSTPAELQYAIAHEMFHNVQLHSYRSAEFPYRRSWLEAAAEYAACRIAMPEYKFWGKLDKEYRQKVLTKYLTKELTYFSFWNPAYDENKDPWANHEYAAVYFVDHICREGAALKGMTPQEYFTKMFKAATNQMAHLSDGWDGVAAFLLNEHQAEHSLPRQYADFAMHYLLDPKSPMYFKLIPGTDELDDRTSSGPVEPGALEAAYLLAEDGTAQNHTFSFEEKLTSKIIKATLKSTKNDKWSATVVALESPEDVFVTAYKLKKDDRAQGGEPDLLPNPPTKFPKIYSFDKDDALYIVASSVRASQSVHVVIKPQIDPPLVGIWEGRPAFSEETLRLIIEREKGKNITGVLVQEDRLPFKGVWDETGKVWRLYVSPLPDSPEARKFMEEPRFTQGSPFTSLQPFSAGQLQLLAPPCILTKKGEKPGDPKDDPYKQTEEYLKKAKTADVPSDKKEAGVEKEALLSVSPGGGKFADVREEAEKYLAATEKFAVAVESVTGPGDVVAALDAVTEAFKSFALKLKAHPEFKEMKNPPEELAGIMEKFAPAVTKTKAAMEKIKPYAADPKVKEALKKLEDAKAILR